MGDGIKILLTALLALRVLPGPALAQEKAIPYGDNPAAGHYYPVRGIRMY